MSFDDVDGLAPGAHGTEGAARHRKNANKQSNIGASTDCSDTPAYTEEQYEAVKSIHRCKDYYEILGVNNDCTEDDLKRAYKKLALKFHPDKNHAPGATEAFKAIGNAFSVLSSPEKRQRYDRFGTEEEQVPVMSERHFFHNGGYEYDFTRGFEGDISPEELFNMFFGAGFQTVHRSARIYRQHTSGPRFHHYHHHHPRRHQPANTDSSPFAALMQLSPVLFMIVFWCFTSLLAPDPLYSRQTNSKFNVRRVTANLKVTYYVKSDFTSSFQGSLQHLEQQVEEDHVNHLKANCLNEKSYRESVLWHARSHHNSKLYEETLNKKLPSCEALRQIYGSG